MCDHRLFFFRPLASVHRMAGARGTNSTGRKKVHRAPAVLLVSLKSLAVEEAEVASRKKEMLLCWFLPESPCQTALLPGRGTAML